MAPMGESLRELWRYRELLRQLVARDLKVRYQNSAVGFLWSIVPPLLQALVYSFLIKSVLNVKAENYGAYVLCGLIPWTFFSVSILDAAHSLVHNEAIVKKVYMPREVIPLSSVAGNFAHFLLGWTVYFSVYYVVFRLIGHGGIPVLATALWFPLITLMMLLLTMGISLWISILGLFYKDTKFIVQTLFNLLFFLAPVLYPADSLYYKPVMQAHPWLFKLYLLNPVASLINAYRKTLLEDIPAGTLNVKGPSLPMDWPLFAASCLLCVVIAASGYAYFNRHKWEIVERM